MSDQGAHVAAGLQGTNFEGDSSRDQDTSALGQPPTDYQTPKEHAAGHRDAQDSLGSATGSSAPQYESSSSSKALPSRSPLLEKPIDDHTVGIANEHPTGGLLEPRCARAACLHTANCS